MTAATLDIDTLAPEVAPGVRLLPVVHARVDMAGLVRLVLDAVDPSAVAVEVPTTLAGVTERAVERLPRISVVVSQEDLDEEALIWLVVPGDPFVEALRWARANDRPVHFIDPDVRYVERHRDPVPDPHALWELGPATYVELLRRALGRPATSRADTLREAGMAYHIQRAVEAGSANQGGSAAPGRRPLLALVGAAHAQPLAEQLRRPQAVPLARRRRDVVELRHLHPDSLSGLLHDPPLAHAAYELLRGDRLPPRPAFRDTLARKVTLELHGLRLVSGRRADERAERGEQLALLTAHECGGGRLGYPRVVDRHALTDLVWRVGAASYEEQTQESMRPWQGRLFFDFVRRYTRVQGGLLPGLYEWVVAGRGVGDDNLAWELFDVGRTYPWQSEEAEIPTARVDGDLLDLGTRRVRFRRRFFRVKRRLVQVPVKPHAETSDPETWIEGFDSFGLCSFPPEDIVIEDYGRFLQRKAVSVVSAERQRTEPFTTSLLDGVDIRETMRNYHTAPPGQQGRIYVHEMGRVPGDAGSVVVIFDRDRQGDRFPYLMTWLGEHDQESDMAFYATNPAVQVVGPGITRATYGGFMLTYPPGRLFDVWRDPDYQRAYEKAEVLLMAGIDYSTGTYVVHVAKDPPAERMRAFAGRRKKRIVHIPLGSLSPVTLKNIRVVHLLAGQDKRAIAKDYIW